MDHYRFTRSGSRTLCWYHVKPDLGFVGIGEHEDPEEAKRLAYEDAFQKVKVISISNLATYHQLKMRRQGGKPNNRRKATRPRR